MIAAVPDLVLMIDDQTIGSAGIVRVNGLDLADETRSRLSRGKLTPFSERGRAVVLEDFAAVEMAVLVEVVMD